MEFDSYITERTVGQFPLSIATSLAIESLLGIHPDIEVSRPPILETNYQELWINIRTLYRNLIGALDKNAVSGISSVAVAEAISLEMETIESIIKDTTKDKTKVVFYVSNYKDIEKKYGHALIRRDNTEKQKEYTLAQMVSIKELLKYHDKEILVFDLKLKAKNPSRTALIITHYAYDLLSKSEFHKLTLLESHTGKFKEQAQWYTKYLNGKELNMIPFREDLIQIFGDSEMFKPMDIRLRNEIIEIAKKYRWSAVTKSDFVFYGMDNLQNPQHKEIVKSILMR